MTANVITYRSKLASREMGKVLGSSQTLGTTVFGRRSWSGEGRTTPLTNIFGKADLCQSFADRLLSEPLQAGDRLPRHLGSTRAHGRLPGTLNLWFRWNRRQCPIELSCNGTKTIALT